MSKRKDNEYYFDEMVRGRIVVTVEAANQKEAVEKFKRGEWATTMEVEIEGIGTTAKPTKIEVYRP